MSTTIDSLQIEIQSNSSGAAAGIDSLATALGKLKANGAIGVAVRNLGKLSDALKQCSAVAGSAGTLNSLADAVTKLSGAGSFAKVVNQLNKLPSALNGLKNVNLDGIDGKIDRIVSATSKLSTIKSGGLGTLVNSLAKIGDVTDKLDDDTISKFADRISKLNDTLSPLSQKMTTVSAGFKAINSNAKTAGSGLGVVNSKINTLILNFSNLVVSLQGIISTIRPIVGLLSSVIGQAIEWDGIAARFGRGFGAQADEVYNWILRLNKEMGINVQQFMQYSSTYATMLSGFGVASKDASKMALGYMELTYDIWAGYNDIYKSMDEAATAIRSAIAGEVEPVRKAGFTIIESTLEQTAANHGLSISLENATEAQKSYLRYLTLVDQAHAQGLVGTYARELNTAEGLMRTFSQQLKSLAQTFGSLFLPILVKVMPWLQAFVGLLTDAVRAVASFFGITIQEVDWGGSGGLGGLGDAADSATGSLDDTAGAVDDVTDALKDLKKATIGIDELNVISPPKENANAGGSGAGEDGLGGLGSGGLDIDSLWDESIFDSIQDQVDEIKAKIKDWLPVLEIVGGALAGLSIATLLKNLGDALSMMNTLQKVCASLAILTIEAAIVFTLADNYLETGNLLYILGEALVTAAAGYLMFKAWGAGGAVLALAVSVSAQLVAMNNSLKEGGVSLSDPELWIQGISTALMSAIGGAWIASKTGFPKGIAFVLGLSVGTSLVLASIRNGGIASGEISNDSWESWVTKIGSVIASAVGGSYLGKTIIKGSGGSKTGFLIGATVGMSLNLIGTVESKGEDFGNEISDWIDVAITTAMAGCSAASLWKLIGPTITSALSGLAGKVGAWLSAGGAATLASALPWVAIATAVAGYLVLTFADYDFTEIGKTVGEKLGEALKWCFDYLSPIGLAIKLGEWLMKELDVETIGEFLAVIFDPDTWTEKIFPSIGETFERIGEWIGEKFANLAENIGEFQDGFLEGLGKAFNIDLSFLDFLTIDDSEDLCNTILAGIFPDVAIKNWLWDLGKRCIPSLWNGLVKGWGEAQRLFKVGVSLVKSGWSTVKGWIGSIPKLSQAIGLVKSGWSTIKKWIGSIPRISQGIGLAKSGWSTVKKWIGNMPTLSAGIKLVKSGWTSISKWLGNLSYKLSFKLPKIGVKWGTKEVLGFKISYPSSFYTYAKGGFPDMGEMFIAREAGPEMVGRIGSKTTVANNDQIVAAVSEGVYEAVVSAMRMNGGNNGEQAVNVYLDGKQITSVVERRQSERGASIMGKQVYGY